MNNISSLSAIEESITTFCDQMPFDDVGWKPHVTLTLQKEDSIKVMLTMVSLR
jgi:hypothetical protein